MWTSRNGEEEGWARWTVKWKRNNCHKLSSEHVTIKMLFFLFIMHCCGLYFICRLLSAGSMWYGCCLLNQLNYLLSCPNYVCKMRRAATAVGARNFSFFVSSPFFGITKWRRPIFQVTEFDGRPLSVAAKNRNRTIRTNYQFSVTELFDCNKWNRKTIISIILDNFIFVYVETNAFTT